MNWILMNKAKLKFLFLFLLSRTPTSLKLPCLHSIILPDKRFRLAYNLNIPNVIFLFLNLVLLNYCTEFDYWRN